MKTIMGKCCICGENVLCSGTKPNRSSLTAYKHGKVYCSEECIKEKMRQSRLKSGKWLTNYNKQYASERMKKNNPMENRTTVEKMMTTKRANGTLHVFPAERGGNGKGLSVPQQMLAVALGWQTEVPVRAKTPLSGIASLVGLKIAHAYKVDIGNTELKIAIEVDGQSHRGKRKTIDSKKDMCLKMLGWKVLRFTNKQVMEHLEVCVKDVLSII